MKDHFFLLFPLSLNVLLLLVTNSSSNSVIAGAPCADIHCLFLPYISSPAPVRINDYLVKGGIGQTLRVVGHVETTTLNAVYNVNIEMKVFDANDQLLTATIGTTVFTATLAGQLNPFDFGVGVDESQVARTEIEIVSWSLSSVENYYSATIVMTDTLVTPTITYITTTIRNDHVQALLNIQAVAWSLDQTSCICAQPVVDYLAPGATSVFTSTVYVSPFGRPIKVAAQGVINP